MMIKQKIAMLVVAFGLMAGLTGAFIAPMVMAAPSGTGCITAPDPCPENDPTSDSSNDAADKKVPGPCDPDNKDRDKNTCCGDVQTSIIQGNLFCGSSDSSTDLKNSSIWKLLIQVLNILTAGIGIAAVGGIVYGALLYTTAENKPEQTKRAISIITNVVIGLVAYGLMFVLLNYLIPGGIFSQPEAAKTSVSRDIRDV